MRPNRRMPGTQSPAKQETPVSDHQESPAFMRGEEVNLALDHATIYPNRL